MYEIWQPLRGHMRGIEAVGACGAFGGEAGNSVSKAGKAIKNERAGQALSKYNICQVPIRLNPSFIAA